MIRSLGFRSLIAAACSFFVLGALASAETRKTPTRTFPLKAGGLLSVENIDGDVTIEGWNREEIRIDAVKEGNPKSLDRMKIFVESTEDRVHISTEYLESRFDFLEEDDEYLESKSDYLESRLAELESQITSGSIDYEIKAPASAILDGIELINGSLVVKGMTGRVTLSTVNGKISATGLADSADIETVNGALDLTFDKLGGEQSIDIATVNGAIVLRIPATASADIDAETINGDISNEFKLKVEDGRWIGSSMSGRLGSGGAYIGLETVNGNIEIKKK